MAAAVVVLVVVMMVAAVVVPLVLVLLFVFDEEVGPEAAEEPLELLELLFLECDENLRVEKNDVWAPSLLVLPLFESAVAAPKGDAVVEDGPEVGV